MQLLNDCNPNLRRMFNRLGWVDVAPSDAIATTGRFRGEWTLQPWRRPEGTEYVNVPAAWETLVFSERIQLARETGARINPNLDSAAQTAEADSIINEYLAGTKHPEA